MTVEPSSQPTGAPRTGDARVDEATAALSELDALPVSDHVDRYTDVHGRLHDILNGVDSPASSVD